MCLVFPGDSHPIFHVFLCDGMPYVAPSGAAVGIPAANSVKVTRNIKGLNFIIIIIIIITISFMQGIYTYIYS
jgi:hypothetical protein